MTPAPIKQWHAYMDSLDAATLKDLLTEDVVFESPVVHTPQVGRSITMKYLLGAAAVLNNDSFHYTGEWFSPNGAVGAGSMVAFSNSSKTSRGTFRVVPWTRMPAISRDQAAALRWASSRSVKVSPSHQLSRT